jgi:hypothetical protein
VSDGNTVERRRHPRKDLDSDVEFIVQGDVLDAGSVDISDEGIRLVTPGPILISLRVPVNGEQREYNARLVWAESTPEGKINCGFEFVEDQG